MGYERERKTCSFCKQDDDVQGSFFVHSLQGESDNETLNLHKKIVNEGISIAYLNVDMDIFPIAKDRSDIQKKTMSIQL